MYTDYTNKTPLHREMCAEQICENHFDPLYSMSSQRLKVYPECCDFNIVWVTSSPVLCHSNISNQWMATNALPCYTRSLRCYFRLPIKHMKKKMQNTFTGSRLSKNMQVPFELHARKSKLNQTHCLE